MPGQPQKPSQPKPETSRTHVSQDSERYVIGAILVNDSYLDAVAEIVRPDDFFFKPNASIFSACLLLQAEGRAIDSLTLMEKMKDLGTLEDAGGVAYLASLTDGMPRISNAEHYAKIVKEKSQLRMLSRAGEVVGKRVQETGDPKMVVEDLERTLQAFYEDQSAEIAKPVSLSAAVQETTPIFRRSFNANGGNALMGIPTGHKKLDEILAGWIPGELVVLGARPSLGKSAFTLDLVRRQAKLGNASLFISLEMSRASLVTRLLCIEAHVDSHKIRTGTADEEQRGRLYAAMSTVSNWPIWISEPARLWSHDVVRRVRSFSAQHPIKLVVVDYLQLLRAKAENRVQEIGKITQDLKEAARILGKQSGGTVIATAQLSRIEPNERPRLDHLRESGSIEADADVVLFLWNADEMEPGQKQPYRKFIGVGKQRNGPLDVMRVMFEAETNEFYEADEQAWNYWGDVASKSKSGSGKKKGGRRKSGD